jgi:transcriptional regulator with PAS, ATPase and Fis domain
MSCKLILPQPWPGPAQLVEFGRFLSRQQRPMIGIDGLARDWLQLGSHDRLTAMQSVESDLIAAKLREHSGNKVAAATALGISRSSLCRKTREYRQR